MSDIAIIIPAYKPDFLRQTLESLVAQSDRDFRVYIGDDCSPHDIKSIVDGYTDKLDIIYKRFGENLGGRDLVAQWERCIAMSTEPWIWLFSDDDMMSPDCVATVKKAFKSGSADDVYRLNVEVVDNEGEKMHDVIFPKALSPRELLKGKLSGKYCCYVVEYVFSRRAYEKFGGFVKFDLAWGSDLATWLCYAQGRDIQTLSDARVFWRSSGTNISTIENPSMVERKCKALIEFLKWGKENFPGTDVDVYSDFGLVKRLLAFNLSRKDASRLFQGYTTDSVRRLLLLTVFGGAKFAKGVKNVFRR